MKGTAESATSPRQNSTKLYETYLCREQAPLNSAYLCRGIVSLCRFYFHLTVFAIEFKAETFSVIRYQIIGLFIRRAHSLMDRTPAHAITQAVFAEHQHGIFHPFLFISLSHLLHSMFPIKRSCTGVHYVSQISKCSLRIIM